MIGASAMAGYVGGGGIGALVLNYGYNRFNFTLMYSLIVVLIIITQCKDEAVMAKRHHQHYGYVQSNGQFTS